MADLDTVTKLINSPPGQLVAGAALAGIVWKFFDKVEGVLTDRTKHEIARWLRVRCVESGLLTDSTVTWPGTCATIFDRVFGEKHLSWKCFLRSTFVSLVLSMVAWIMVTFSQFHNEHGHLNFTPYIFFRYGGPILLGFCLLFNALPDYVSLLVTRWLLTLMRKGFRSKFAIGIILIVDFSATIAISLIPYIPVRRIDAPYKERLWVYAARNSTYEMMESETDEERNLFFERVKKGDSEFRRIEAEREMSDRKAALERVMLPAIWTSIVLWLYGLSGLVIRIIQRLDLGFDWFNRTFDIEEKPLSAIGLVAGSFVALFYWSWATFRHFVPA